MIEYELKDEDGNTYSLNGDAVTRQFKDTWTQDSDRFSYENKLLRRSYLPGSILVGNPRIEGRSISLAVNAASSDPQVFRDEVNELLEFAARARYLVDVTNDMQLSVVVSNTGIDYAKGSLKLMSVNEIEFTALTPYWEALTADQETGTALADSIEEISINNEGFLPSPIIVTLITSAAVNSVQMYHVDKGVGVQVDDDIFGTTGNLTMIIDGDIGEVSIGPLNRNASIVEGTGFFEVPPGASTVNLLPADEDVSYTVKYFKRYFI